MSKNISTMLERLHNFKKADVYHQSKFNPLNEVDKINHANEVAMLEELVKLRLKLADEDKRDSSFTLESISKVTGYDLQSLETFERNPEAYLHNKTFVRLYMAAVGVKITYTIENE